MTTHDRNLLQQGVRSNFTTFIHKCLLTVSPGITYLHNWHIDAMAHQLLQCAEGPINRLAITVPPRHLKSICSSVALTAWLLGNDPTRKIIVVSYSKELADKFSRDFRQVVNSEWYKQAFPRMRARRDTDNEFETTQGGYRLATSVGGTLTGRGADFIIIDDPIKPTDAASKTIRESVTEWFRTTLLSRLNDKRRGRIVIVMRRLHVDDLIGYVVESAPGDWAHLDLPAIAMEDQRIPIGDELFHERSVDDVLDPVREPLTVLESIRQQMGSTAFSAQYLQRPIPAEGSMILHKWLHYYDSLPAMIPNMQIVQSWDTASTVEETSDYSVCTTWWVVNGKYYLVDVVRVRVDYPGLRQLVIQNSVRHNATTVIIEDKGAGTSLIQDLRHEGRVHPVAFLPQGSKEMRMYGQTSKFESGQVLLPQKSDWLDEYRNEILAFPGSRHDDQVDSTSQFLEWISTRSTSSFSCDWGWGNPSDGGVRFPYL